ncbi:MAG: tetratricopeptide repeat protein, partial [bacterium]|nr:tetratricopeptide repeat protein [bacterium]
MSKKELGSVAQETRDWEEAKRNYREALKIYKEFSDRYSPASTYANLGAVA